MTLGRRGRPKNPEPVFSACRVFGGSMLPLLRSGEMAIVENDPDAAGPGDIVLYRAGGKLLMHRLAFRKSGLLWLFDDADCAGWHRVRARNLIGRLRHDNPLACGVLGLVYGLFASLVFKIGRLLRRAAWKLPR